MLQFVCDVVKDTGKEEYLRPFREKIQVKRNTYARLFALDWIGTKSGVQTDPVQT